MQHPTRVPAFRRRSLQSVSGERDSWYERPTSDGLLLEGFFDSQINLSAVCPETALMYAVLEDAFLCYQKQFEANAGVTELTRAAEDWFLSDDSRWLFSFVSVCHALGLEPQYIRKKLRRCRASHMDITPTNR
jgi:hypothetical protein